MKLTEIQLDALREVANIGAGNAATSLSRLLEKRIQMQVTAAHLVPIGEVARALGGAERLVTLVCFQVRGPAAGDFTLIFSEGDADRLAFRLLGRGAEKAVRRKELAESALKELGNVYAGTYFKALSEMTNLRFTHSVPEMATDMLQSLLDGILIRTAANIERVFVLETHFEVEGNWIQTHALFLPDAEGLEVLLKGLHLKIGEKGWDREGA